MAGAHTVVLIGGPGTGKTHIATALGFQAVERHRKKVRFFATADLVNALEQEKAATMANHSSARTTKLYGRRSDDVCLDEVERILI